MLSVLIARSLSSLRKLENWQLISSVTMVTHFMRRFFSFEAILFWRNSQIVHFHGNINHLEPFLF